MGSRCRIVAPTASLASRGRQRVHELERRWTRFRDSELTRVNDHRGDLCLVSTDLHAVLTVAELAHRLSGGLFDIRVLDAVVDAGYRSALDARPGRARPPAPVDLPVELFDAPPAVLVPTGCRIDLGGIGKGFAADIVTTELRAAGAPRVQVELGGDLRTSGRPWVGDAWSIEVEDPRVRRGTVAHLDIAEGAVATSSVLRKRWNRDGRTTHHLIDPRTMRPATTDLVAVTAVAAEAWRAEVAAKCAVIVGADRAPEVLERLSATGLLFTDEGTVLEVFG